MATRKKAVKKKAIKKKAVKKKTAKKKTAKKTNSKSHDPDIVAHSVVEANQRLLDVVEANTLAVKAMFTVLAQMQQMFMLAMNPQQTENEQINLPADDQKTVAAEQRSKDKPAKRGRKKKEPKPPVETPQTETVETSPENMETDMPTMAQLSAGYKNMKQMIGEQKAAEYLNLFDGAKTISSLDEKYWCMFRDRAKDFVENVREQEAIADKKEELSATGIEPDKNYSEAEVRQKLNDVANAYGKTDVLAGRSHAINLLARFGGAKSVPQLDKSSYNALVAACDAELVKI